VADFQKKLDWFLRLNAVVKFFSAIQIAAPIAVAVWTSVMGMAEDLPRAQIIVLFVLSLAGALLCITQIKSLLGIPVVVRSHESLEYGLAFSEVNLGLDASNPATALQVILGLRNSAREAIQFQIERFDVIIGNTTLSNKTNGKTATLIPLAGYRVYRDTPLPSNLVTPLLGAVHSGMLEAFIVYGRPGQKPTRRYKLKLELTVQLVGPTFGIADAIREESDEPIFG
jgi:hypothetical protein